MNNLKWTLPDQLLPQSIAIMRSHGARGNEGIALWFGHGNENESIVTHVVEPFGPGLRTTPRHLSLSIRAMLALTDLADGLGMFLIGQIHSHPGTFVDLSMLDEIHGIRTENYLSVVCPHYAQRPSTGFRECGVHVFNHPRYRRLSCDETQRRICVRSTQMEKLQLEVK